MSDQSSSRFTPQNKTTHERLSTNTVGLVALSDFRKRRAEVLEQQEREAREAAIFSRTNVSTPDRSQTATPNNASDNSDAERHKKKKKRKALVSFGGDEEEEDGGSEDIAPPRRVGVKSGKATSTKSETNSDDKDDATGSDSMPATAGQEPPKKITPNASVGIVPRLLTKSALRREVAEKEALRKEFLELQKAVKATDIAVPFVFYDGTNIPGGTVRAKKGDPVWLFLDRSRKVGAELGVGGEKSATARRDWARVGVDDLMLVRGSIIIPHHYDFYFFIINKTIGPEGKLLFGYSAEAPPKDTAMGNPVVASAMPKGGPDIGSLEGAADDPTFTKVVDRRWYQRHKHIYPASVWQEFDPDKDYRNEIRRDTGGNAFFYSK